MRSSKMITLHLEKSPPAANCQSTVSTALRGYFTRHHWGAGGAQTHRQDHAHPSSLFPPSIYSPDFPSFKRLGWLVPKHKWEHISISKGWGRQGRNPKTHAKTPMALTEPGLHPLKPGLGWGLHFMKSYASCSFPVWRSAPLQLRMDMRKHKQKLSTSAHVRIGNAWIQGCRAGFRVPQYLVHNLLSLSPCVSVVAIITLFLTVLLPRESLHRLCTYLACTRIF